MFRKKPSSDGVGVTFVMHLSMLTPQRGQTGGMARPDKQECVC